MKKYRLRVSGNRYIGGMLFAGKYGKVNTTLHALTFDTRTAADAAAITYTGSWVEEYEAEPATMKAKA